MQPHDPRWCALLRGPVREAQRQSRPASAAPAREVDRADFDPAYRPDAPITCELCGFEMRYTAACKLACSNCGYKRDCSDP
jgi:hypothetical protein